MQLNVQIITFRYQHETLRWLDSISLLNSILCDLCSFEASKPCWVSSASLLFHCTTSIPITLIGLNQCTTSIQINFIGLTKNILRIYVDDRKWINLSPPRFLNWFSIYTSQCFHSLSIYNSFCLSKIMCVFSSSSSADKVS